MSGFPLISVVTVCYNAAATINQTILSVLNQSYPYIEYVIIDGGSTDGTVDIIRQYADRLAYWCSEPDKGIYDAMNKGIEKTTGELIGIINADDWYEDGIFEKISKAYLYSDKYSILHGDMITIALNGDLERRTPKYEKDKMYMGAIFFHPTMFVPKSVYQNINTFDITYKIAGDYDFMVRAWKKGVNYIYLGEVVSYMRAGGLSDSQIYKGYEENRKIIVKYGYHPLVAYKIYCINCFKTITVRLLKAFKIWK